MLNLNFKTPSKTSFTENLISHYDYYKSLPKDVSNLETYIDQVKIYVREFKKIYPQYQEPDVYFIIGKLNSGGTTLDGKVLIGIETFASEHNAQKALLPSATQKLLLNYKLLPALIFHEMMHSQQAYKGTKECSQDYGSLLATVIAEGSADFLSEYFTGDITMSRSIFEFGLNHEKAIWEKFEQEIYSKDFSNFLYNSNTATKDWPEDLGYFMGYQITKAYFDNAPDKAQAIHDILNISCFTDFLEASGYPEKFNKKYCPKL